MDTLVILGKRLRELRTENNYTQIQVASKLGVSREAYSYYENGKKQPSINSLTILADLYKTSIDYLVGRY